METRKTTTEDKHCPAAALRRELGLAAVTIARRLGLSVRQVMQCLKAMPDYDWCDHPQLAVVRGGYALACAGCDAVAPAPFVTIRTASIGSAKVSATRYFPGMEDEKYTEVPVRDEASAFELAEECGWRDVEGQVWCPACLGRIGPSGWPTSWPTW